MKIETKLALNNVKKNKKRTLYTTISLTLCTTLILTVILLISSIRNGVSENFESEYNDYHITVKDVTTEQFNRIKSKKYIDKIYIQKSEDSPLEKVDSSYTPENNITAYLRYKNIRQVRECTDDIINELGHYGTRALQLQDDIKFNQKLFTVYGLIDVQIENTSNIPNVIKMQCVMRVNYSYVIDIMLVLVIAIFSVLFIMILYNAFLITINERKKEYAVLNSVGGTENQILKMIFTEAILMGIVGIIVGGILSYIAVNIVLNSLNNILASVGYCFRLAVDTKYVLFALALVAINIYISVLIPTSSASVMQDIRNNNQIKYKKKNTLLERILPIEGRTAIKNVKRNKNKYTIIIVLLVVCMVSYISVTTYISYEKEAAELVQTYDVDIEIWPDEGKVDYYKIIFAGYEEKYNKKLEYIEYRVMDAETFLLEPKEAWLLSKEGMTCIDNLMLINIRLIALDEEIYCKYIEKINANYGDFIIYNNTAIKIDDTDGQYEYTHVFNPEIDLKLKLAKHLFNEKSYTYDYESVADEYFNKRYILTDEIIEGFKEIKTLRKGYFIY